MRWSWLALALAALAAHDVSTARAQPAPKPTDKPEGWSELDVEPDAPPPAPGPKPRPADASPYRPPPPPSAPTPRPQSAPPGDTEVITDDAGGGALPESIMWMKAWTPKFATRHVRAELDVWPHDVGTTFTWDVVLQLGVDDVPVFFDVDLPWTYYDFDTPATNEEGELMGGLTHLGNPTLGVHGGGVVAEVVGFWGGAWVAIPSENTPLSADGATPPSELPILDIATLLSAWLTRNGVEGHRFFPLGVPVRWAFGIEGQLFPLIYLRTDLYSTLYIPTASEYPVIGTLEQISELEVLSPVGAGAGLRYQTLFGVTNSLSDGSVHGLEPYLLYRAPLDGPFAFPLLARVGVLVGLTDVPGASFDGGKVVTVRSMLGYRF